MEILKLDQINGRNRRLCTNIQLSRCTAVCYDEKPVQDGQRCDFRDIVIYRRNELCMAVRLNQPAGGTIDCTIHVPDICQTFSLESQYSLYSETLKHIFKTNLRSKMQIPAVIMYSPASI